MGKLIEDKHGKHCYNQWKHFTKFVLSIDCILGREALAVLAKLIRMMAEKMDDPILNVRGWINSWIDIAVTTLYSRMNRVAQLNSTLWYSEPYWDP